MTVRTLPNTSEGAHRRSPPVLGGLEHHILGHVMVTPYHYDGVTGNRTCWLAS